MFPDVVACSDEFKLGAVFVVAVESFFTDVAVSSFRSSNTSILLVWVGFIPIPILLRLSMRALFCVLVCFSGGLEAVLVCASPGPKLAFFSPVPNMKHVVFKSAHRFERSEAQAIRVQYQNESDSPLDVFPDVVVGVALLVTVELFFTDVAVPSCRPSNASILLFWVGFIPILTRFATFLLVVLVFFPDLVEAETRTTVCSPGRSLYCVIRCWSVGFVVVDFAFKDAISFSLRSSNRGTPLLFVSLVDFIATVLFLVVSSEEPGLEIIVSSLVTVGGWDSITVCKTLLNSSLSKSIASTIESRSLCPVCMVEEGPGRGVLLHPHD